MRINRVKLVSEMTRKDMTVKRLAELARVSRATVTGVKTGKTCSQTTGDRIASALGVPVEELLEEEE